MYEDMFLLSNNADTQSLGYSHIKYFVGLANAYLGEPGKAVTAFEESLLAEPGAEHAMTMAAFMASNEYYDEALHLSDLALSQLDTIEQGVSRGATVTATGIQAFQRIVRTDIEVAAAQKTGARPSD
jgi:hypothetical protein